MDHNKLDPSSQHQQSTTRPSQTNQQHSASQQNESQLPQHQHQPSNQPTQSSQSQLTQSSQQLQNTNPNFDSNVISERVKNLATQIYQELKRIISRCNYDEDILSGLMPLIVRVLESLDLALIDNQQLQVELELCKDDNEQLVVMFEKEKAAKRISDKKLIESEFAYEEERQQYQQKIESLDGIVKMMELKAKNASDQATRLEEKENERKKEYQKLHDRYTELLKSHCDVVERVRHLVGNQEVASLNSINVPQQMVASASSDINFSDLQQPIHQLSNKMRQLRSDEHVDQDNNLKGLNKASRDALKSWNAESELTLEDASLVVIEDVLGTGGHSKPQPTQHASQTGDTTSQNESDRINPGELDSGEHEKESENDSIAYTSMEKEFRKLIQDNKDLLKTKNALNVVKDDLIAEVDRLTNEVSMYEQAVEQLNSTKEQMKQKVSLLDAELRKTKDELEKAKQKIRENNEEGVPYAQRKRFGRAEMAKVLMERNEYKEKFMELQDAIKYTELVRANKSESEKRSGLWKFFSNLFSPPQPLAIGPGTPTLTRSSSTLVSFNVGPDHHQSSIYGSALAGKPSATTRIPIPQYCRPLTGDSPGMKIWCATVADLTGGELASIDKQPKQLINEELSSCVWICSTQHSRSKITIIDVKNKPNEMLESFSVPTFLYCIKSVPGCNPFDLPGLTHTSSNRDEDKQQAQNDQEVDDPEMDANRDDKVGPVRRGEKSPLMLLIEKLIATQSGNFYQLVSVDAEEANRALQERIAAKYNLMRRQNSFQNQSQCSATPSNTFDQSSEEVVEISLNDEISFSQQRANESSNLNSSFLSTISSSTTINQSGNLDNEDPAISRILDNNVCDGIAKLEKLNDFVAHSQEESQSTSPITETSINNNQQDDKSQSASAGGTSARKLSGPHHHPISTHLPTVWMGGKDSILYVHSAIGQWGDLVDCVKLPDSILQIFHYRGRVFVALADGLLCVFFRDLISKQWDLRNYLQIDINLLADNSAEISSDYSSNNENTAQQNRQRANTTNTSHTILDEKSNVSMTSLNESSEPVSLSEQLRDATEKQHKQQEQMARNRNTILASHRNRALRSKVAGIRCIELANNNLWIGYRNRVLIMDPISLKLKHSLTIIPQLDNQVRQLVAMQDGVFCCLRSDLMLRLYSSLKPYQHIQNMDIEPVVTRLLSPRTFVISHITSMKVADNMLWIGIAHGVIITIPCTLETLVSETIPVGSPARSSPNASMSSGGGAGLETSDNDYLTSMSIAKSIPKCDVANAQISFHGHKDAVKFFINTHGLMLSGGQGYLDFRLDTDDQSKSINDKSHLILWQMPDKGVKLED